MDNFSTEINLIHHVTIRECLRSAKLICDLDDEHSLQEYSNNLLRKIIEEQVVYFPNNKRAIDAWVVEAR